MRLLLTKLGLLNEKDEYAEIKVSITSKGAEKIMINIIGQEGRATDLTNNPKVVDLIDNVEAKAFTTM